MLTRKIIFKAGLFHVIYGIILEINISYDKYTRFSEAETNPQSEGECCSNNNLTVSKKKKQVRPRVQLPTTHSSLKKIHSSCRRFLRGPHIYKRRAKFIEARIKKSARHARLTASKRPWGWQLSFELVPADRSPMSLVLRPSSCVLSRIHERTPLKNKRQDNIFTQLLMLPL